MSQYPPSGPRKTVDDFDDDEDVTRRGSAPNDPNRPTGGDRQFTYYPEERYWTDYIKIAAPVLGVIILLALAWLWLSHLIGGDNTTASTPDTSSASGPVIITGSPTASQIAGAPTVVSTATGTESATPAAPGGTIAVGANVLVANTGESGVNMRDAASTDSNVISTLTDGSALTITGESVEAEGYTWWPVKDSDGNAGFVVQDYLEPAP